MNAHEVSKNLWVGAVPTDPAAVSKQFDALVLCAKEFQDVFPQHMYPKTDLILAPMNDGKPTDKEKYIALKAALGVRSHLDKGHKVLVTCAAGVNRSALVAALAMMMGEDTAKSAVDTIRKKRKATSGATPLFNVNFVKYINEVWDAISTRTQTAAA
jgi:protein-tyrosine phosphatase